MASSFVLRTGITTGDAATDMSTAGAAGANGANLVSVTGYNVLELEPKCSAPGGSTTLEVVFYDSAFNVLGGESNARLHVGHRDGRHTLPLSPAVREC